jgi:hypothetical protein
VASLGAAIAKVTRQLMLVRVAAAREIAIAGGLVAIGRDLVAIGSRLVAVGRRLVALGSRLVGVRERLAALERPRRSDKALRLCVAHPVPGIDVPIA